MSSRIPAYPLITIDPYVSVWSQSDCLNGGDTYLWTGHKKSLQGYIYIDGAKYRFLGEGSGEVIKQSSVDIDFISSKYVFEDTRVRLTVEFWGAQFLDDIDLMSTPLSYIDYKAETLDGSCHSIVVEIAVDSNFTYDKYRKKLASEATKIKDVEVVSFGQKKQRQLRYSADHAGIDWGNFYLLGKSGRVERGNIIMGVKAIVSESSGIVESGKPLEDFFIFGYDDGYSLEYFGVKYRGYWTKRFGDIYGALEYFYCNRLQIKAKRDGWNSRLKDDAAKYFGDDYIKILKTAYRQVVAAHKLIEDSDGELLYMSKECHSNGCINTVDVSYPSMPLYLLYNARLAQAMLNGVFKFAESSVWTADFAPHDLGRYPIANGQVYALKIDGRYNRDNHIKLYEMTNDIYWFSNQMPIEECGNMLIMSYAQSVYGKDISGLAKHFNTLTKWANYLVDKGIVLDNQLCTDDFAGHSSKNVNLAIKSVIGIACYAQICKVLGKESSIDYMLIAKQNADELVKLSREGDYLNFSIGNSGSWSLKYNIVWDIIFDFGLFDKEILKGESDKYVAQLNRYGTPLDSRADFTKSDWQMWVSAIDVDELHTDLFAERMVAFLEDTKQRACFTDYYETKVAIERGMDHRSVQGGLWMPIIVKNSLRQKSKKR